jgi:hypothetical protein
MRITALAIALALAAADSPEAHRTTVDMRFLSNAIEAYDIDNVQYPPVKTMEELRAKLSPIYLKTVPMKDAWGTTFAYRYVNGKDPHYRVISAGPDRKFHPSSLNMTKKPAKSDDIIYADGELISRTTFAAPSAPPSATARTIALPTTIASHRPRSAS